MHLKFFTSLVLSFYIGLLPAARAASEQPASFATLTCQSLTSETGYAVELRLSCPEASLSSGCFLLKTIVDKVTRKTTGQALYEIESSETSAERLEHSGEVVMTLNGRRIQVQLPGDGCILFSFSAKTGEGGSLSGELIETLVMTGDAGEELRSEPNVTSLSCRLLRQ